MSTSAGLWRARKLGGSKSAKAPSRFNAGSEPASAGFERGLPDGSCVDAEGFIWNCRVAGGGCVVRFAPDGRIDRVVDRPCSWPTSCVFSGSRFETLFVTSARFTMGVEYLARNQHEGAVFALQPGAHGVPTSRSGGLDGTPSDLTPPSLYRRAPHLTCQVAPAIWQCR
nr:SMP-30/gluconolactonase/LRE family protein [Ensifer adhaerens]